MAVSDTRFKLNTGAEIPALGLGKSVLSFTYLADHADAP